MYPLIGEFVAIWVFYAVDFCKKSLPMCFGMSKIRAAFAEWYDNGHTNENDPNTCLLRMKLTDGVLFQNGTKYEIDFIKGDSQ